MSVASKVKEIAFGNLTLKIGPKEISLSVDEAKRLRTELENLLGKKEPAYVPYVPHIGFIPSVPTLAPPPMINYYDPRSTYNEHRKNLERWYEQHRFALENWYQEQIRYRAYWPYEIR